MLLNRLEYLLMNNPLRAAIQRHVEARQLRRMGETTLGGRVLEIGCGRGVGAEVILDVFEAQVVHGFDLDRRMAGLARRRLAGRGPVARFWVGDAAAIAAPDAAYDAVFDFGVLHHLLEWRLGVAETFRVLRPGGRLYAEEILAPFIRRTRHLLVHPQHDRFDAASFRSALEAAGFRSIQSREIGRSFGWFVAIRPDAA
jgi:ubiquinone/menaquinone biosynthesis C-methylase UbiE